jgi:hypothetical protein
VKPAAVTTVVSHSFCSKKSDSRLNTHLRQQLIRGTVGICDIEQDILFLYRAIKVKPKNYRTKIYI